METQCVLYLFPCSIIKNPFVCHPEFFCHVECSVVETSPERHGLLWVAYVVRFFDYASTPSLLPRLSGENNAQNDRY